MKRVYSIATCLLPLEGIACSITGLIVYDGQLSIDALEDLQQPAGCIPLAWPPVVIPSAITRVREIRFPNSA